jgi:hypothetical protein
MADKGIHNNYLAPIVVGLVVTVAGAGLLGWLGLGDKPDPTPPSQGKAERTDKAIRLNCPETVTIQRNGSELVRVRAERVGFDADLNLSVAYPGKMFSTRRWLLLKAKALLPTTLKRGHASVLVKVHAGDRPGTYTLTLEAATKSSAETHLADAAPLRVVVK